MKRLFDVLLTFIATIFLIVPIVLVAICVRITSKGRALYWSDRVGRDNIIFSMPKFRTMRTNTPAIATLPGRPLPASLMFMEIRE